MPFEPFKGYQPNSTAVQMRSMLYDMAREGWEADRALGRTQSAGRIHAPPRSDASAASASRVVLWSCVTATILELVVLTKKGA